MSPPDPRTLRAPDEAGAQARAWPAVRDAFASRERVGVRRRWQRPALALVALALLAGAITPPGQAVAGYVHDRIVREAPRATAPAPLATRTPGRLLLTTPAGVWVLRADGSGRLLGAYGAGTWSPNGLFAAVARDRTLAAVEPDTGAVRWRLEAAAPVSDVRWSPRDGFRIVYRNGGSELRIVDGDGTGDRLLTDQAGPIAPVWRPGSHRVAFQDRRGRVVSTDVDGGRRQTAPAPAGLSALAYAPDGTLLVLAGGGLGALDPASGRERRLLPAPVRALAVSPGAPHAVLALGPDGAVRQVSTGGGGGRVLATVAGATAIAWSPDARTVLVAEAGADRWHLIDAATGRDRVLQQVAGRLDPDGLGRATFPAVAGWCC